MNPCRPALYLTLLASALLLTACTVPDWVWGTTTLPSTATLAPAKAAVAVTATAIDALGAVAPAESLTPQPWAEPTAVPQPDAPPAPPPAGVELCRHDRTGNSLSLQEALAIARASDCTANGDLLTAYSCDNRAGTWRIGLSALRQGCRRTCVVDVNTRTAAVDGSCGTSDPPAESETGALVEQGIPAPFHHWQGMLFRRQAGALVTYRFQRDDGQWFDVDARSAALRQQLAESAWSGTKVSLSGKQTALTGKLSVEALDQLGARSSADRDLTAFAMPSASSQLPADEGGAYYAWSLIDGDETQPWCEGAAGPGLGQWVQLDFAAPLELARLAISNGFNRDGYLFDSNNRLRSISIHVDGREVSVLQVQDVRGMQSLLLGDGNTPGPRGRSIRIEITSTVPGWRFDDTCIAEIEVWGWPLD